MRAMLLDQPGQPPRLDELPTLEPGPGRVPVQTETVAYPLERANEALADLRAGRLQGAACSFRRASGLTQRA